MGLDNVQRNTQVAGRTIRVMNEQATDGEANIKLCVNLIAKVRSHIGEVIMPLLAEALEDREKGIEHLRQASTSYDTVWQRLESASVDELPGQGQALRAVMQQAGKELATVKQQIMQEVFIEDSDRLGGCQAKLESSTTELKDATFYLSSIVQPGEGTLLQLQAQLTTLGEAVAGYGQDASSPG